MSDDDKAKDNDATITISQEAVEAAVTTTVKGWAIAGTVKKWWRGRGTDAAVVITKKW